MKEIEKLLESLALHGGKIVSTASLSLYQIEVARSESRMYVDENSLGYVWMLVDAVDKHIEQLTQWLTFMKDEADKAYLKNINEENTAAMYFGKANAFSDVLAYLQQLKENQP